MALRQMLLQKKISDKKKELEQLRTLDFTGREKELEAAIDEAETEEEKALVEEQVEALDKEQKETEEKAAQLESEISALESELEGLEDRQQAAPAAVPEKREVKVMPIETRGEFFGMSHQERDAFFARDDVKNYMDGVRQSMIEKRDINNVGLTIPEVMLPLLKQIIEENSKLLPKVNARFVPGNARQVIMGEMPEAVWTDCCATLNELTLGFNDIELGCWKVGGYFDVCNAILEDNDVNLASVILQALGVAISKALDKAIIYGRGTKMPLGIVTRLEQTSRPAGYLPTARPWVDLSTSNIKAGSGATGINLFKEIVKAKKMIKNDYFRNGITWVMNEETYTQLQVEAMDKNSSAAIVTGFTGQMPVIGGGVVTLPFIPDDNIVFGYFDAYTLAERAGRQFATSEHYRFIEDRTIFKGTARYDGVPVIPEAFGVITITADAPAAASTITFPSDDANQTTP